MSPEKTELLIKPHKTLKLRDLCTCYRSHKGHPTSDFQSCGGCCPSGSVCCVAGVEALGSAAGIRNRPGDNCTFAVEEFVAQFLSVSVPLNGEGNKAGDGAGQDDRLLVESVGETLHLNRRQRRVRGAEGGRSRPLEVVALTIDTDHLKWNHSLIQKEGHALKTSTFYFIVTF